MEDKRLALFIIFKLLKEISDFLLTLPKPNEGEGTICVFRRSLFEGSAVSSILKINNVEVFDIKNGSYYCGTFPAGKNALSAEGILHTGVSNIARLEVGDVLIYEIAIQAGAWAARYVMHEVATDYGLSQMLGIKQSIDAFEAQKNIYDPL